MGADGVAEFFLSTVKDESDATKARAYMWHLKRRAERSSIGSTKLRCTRSLMRDIVFQCFNRKAGGKDNGAPGVRSHYAPDYYARFVFDLDSGRETILRWCIFDKRECVAM